MTLTIVLLLIFIGSTMNAIISYDMRKMSQNIINLPIKESVLNILTIGLFSIYYLSIRKEIKKSYNHLFYVLQYLDGDINNAFASEYLSYKNSKHQVENIIIQTLLNEALTKINKSDLVDEKMKNAINNNGHLEGKLQ